jgi:hypothetical protein
LRVVHERKENNVPPPTSSPDRITKKEISRITREGVSDAQRQGFFNEFEQFMRREDMELDGLLEQDIVWKMKEFHKRRQEGKEYYIYSKDVQQAIDRRLSDLKDLEREWFILKESADDIDRSIAGIESEIHTKSQELKELMHQAKDKSVLERHVPKGQEFVLADGQKVSSLLELKIALKNMRHDVFDHHVNHSKNDFAQWMRIAHNNPEVADIMLQATSKGQLELLLGKLAR